MLVADEPTTALDAHGPVPGDPDCLRRLNRERNLAMLIIHP